MNEFCVLVNITPGRSPEGEFLVSPKRDDETLDDEVECDIDVASCRWLRSFIVSLRRD